MKAKELFDMTNKELEVKLDSLKEELFNLRFKPPVNLKTLINLTWLRKILQE